MKKFVVVERVQEMLPAPAEEPEIMMLATPEWFEHRHRIVAAQEAERRARIIEGVKAATAAIVSLLLIFGSCVLLGGY